MKFLKATLAAASLLGLFATSGFAAGAPASPTSQTSPTPAIANYGSFAGTVKEIRPAPSNTTAIKQVLLAQNSDGGEMAFQINDNTYFLTDSKPEVGAKILGFYDANAPMTMIYPPQPLAVVIGINLPDTDFVKVDRFDKDRVSADGQLKLNVSDKTELILQDGSKFTEDFTNRALAVVYNVATKSIPAITTPTKIIVLYEKAAPPIHTLTDEEKAMLNPSPSAEAKPPIYKLTNDELAAIAKSSKNLKLSINGKEVESKPYVENGIFMIPVRAAGEALGLVVEWLPSSNAVQVGKTGFMVIGKNTYSKNRMAAVELSTVPVIKNDRTYAPIDFFEQILGAAVTYTADSIQINLE